MKDVYCSFDRLVMPSCAVLEFRKEQFSRLYLKSKILVSLPFLLTSWVRCLAAHSLISAFHLLQCSHTFPIIQTNRLYCAIAAHRPSLLVHSLTPIRQQNGSNSPCQSPCVRLQALDTHGQDTPSQTKKSGGRRRQERTLQYSVSLNHCCKPLGSIRATERENAGYHHTTQ